ERATDGPRRGAGAPAGAETVAARGVITAPVAITGAIAVGHGGCGRSGEAVRAEYLARRARWSVSSASCCCEPPTDSTSRTTKTCARSRTRRAPPDSRFRDPDAPRRTHPPTSAGGAGPGHEGGPGQPPAAGPPAPRGGAGAVALPGAGGRAVGGVGGHVAAEARPRGRRPRRRPRGVAHRGRVRRP